MFVGILKFPTIYLPDTFCYLTVFEMLGFKKAKNLPLSLFKHKKKSDCAEQGRFSIPVSNEMNFK